MRVDSCIFIDDRFSLNTVFPLVLAPGQTDTVRFSIKTEKTGRYDSKCTLYYLFNEIDNQSSADIEFGVFFDDNTELALEAYRTLKLYFECKNENVSSIATRNNLGVLYYLLDEPDLAKSYFINSLSDAVNAKYGYTGIKMNMGITKSEKNEPAKANSYYNMAFKDVRNSQDSSCLAPQINYNLAWEAYVLENITDAKSYINVVINHAKLNNYLLAKSYVLRGAMYFNEGDVDSAKADFEQAISFDPDGPVGKMAEDNLYLLSSVEKYPGNLPQDYVLHANYPNPFNPSTTISFGLPKDCEIEMIIFNVLGQKVCHLYKGEMNAGYHKIIWDATNDFGNPVKSGVYFLFMKSDNFKDSRKMTLLR